MVLALNFWRLLSQAETPVSEGHQVNKAAVACLVTSTLATPGREVPSTRNRIAILRSVAEENDVAIPEEGGTTRGACSGVSLASPFSLFPRERNEHEREHSYLLSFECHTRGRPPQTPNPKPPPATTPFCLVSSAGTESIFQGQTRRDDAPLVCRRRSRASQSRSWRHDDDGATAAASGSEPPGPSSPPSQVDTPVPEGHQVNKAVVVACWLV